MQACTQPHAEGGSFLLVTYHLPIYAEHSMHGHGVGSYEPVSDFEVHINFVTDYV